LASTFPRTLTPPRGAFFLFGPRGTGKSTWIRTHLDDALVVNLLEPQNALRLEREPALFRAQVLARPKSDWIVVDEVQRVPRLLDEVHFLMEERGYRRFALTGSSARKLRRGAANLLAGRCRSIRSSSACTEGTSSVKGALCFTSRRLRTGLRAGDPRTTVTFRHRRARCLARSGRPQSMQVGPGQRSRAARQKRRL
jgi:predicted AAA+ superfamily ATPase